MKKLNISDNTKITIIRWWFVGAACYFIAFGTSVGENTDPFDLIFFLGIGIGAMNVILFHPIIYHMFDIKRRGVLQNKKYLERGILGNVGLSLLEIFKCMVIVWLVYLVYDAINIILLGFDASDAEIILGVEPILFGIIFVCFYNLFASIVDGIYIAVEKASGKGSGQTENDFDE